MHHWAHRPYRIQFMKLYEKLKKMQILLIDDDEWIRDALRIFFEEEGCRLVALETAEEGIEALQSQDYDIVIADYRLPGMDGLEFLSRIKLSHPNVIQILITAYANDEIVAKANSLGIHELISKPFSSRNIEDSLSRLVQNPTQKPHFEVL